MSASLPIEYLRDLPFHFPAFFETGTSEGDTVQSALEAGFSEIYSVEFHPEIFRKAQRRFVESKNVSLLNFKSVEGLKILIPFIEVPTVFFLDAHPDRDAGESPILEELDEISKFKLPFVIFADDMRLMGQGKWSRSSTSAIQEKILSIHSDFMIDFIGNGHSDRDLLRAVRNWK